MTLADDLDLETAWRKTKRDYNHYMNSFVSTPNIIDIYDRNKTEWFSRVESQIEEGSYTPQFCRVVDIPKSNYHLRPATVLRPTDLLVYSAYILAVYDKIYDKLNWSALERRYSHILYEDPTYDNNWNKHGAEHWKDMQIEKNKLC